MFSRRRGPLLIVVAALASGCGGPFLLLPGGKLEGTAASAPGDWSFLAETKTVQLETRAEDPYSVNIWAIGMGDLVYVHAGKSRSAWVENLEADPSVRLRVDDRIYALRASRVEGQGEFDRFADAYEEKYGSRPRNEVVRDVYLFRLGAP